MLVKVLAQDPHKGTAAVPTYINTALIISIARQSTDTEYRVTMMDGTEYVVSDYDVPKLLGTISDETKAGIRQMVDILLG